MATKHALSGAEGSLRHENKNIEYRIMNVEYRSAPALTSFVIRYSVFNIHYSFFCFRLCLRGESVNQNLFISSALSTHMTKKGENSAPRFLT